MFHLLRNLFCGTPAASVAIDPAPLALRPGDDLVISTSDNLDSDQAFALLNALKQQFSGVRIHLLGGFSGVRVQRKDCGSDGAEGEKCSNPPLPVRKPSVANPFFEAAKASEKGDVMAITYASGFRVVAVYIPPKQQGDSVA